MSKKEDKVIDKLSTGNTISYSVDILLIFARLQPRGKKLKTWNQISKKLEKKLTQDQFNTWIRPLQGEFKENSLEILGSADPGLFKNDFEKNLYKRIHDIRKYFSSIGKTENYEESLKTLSLAKNEIDAFFDNVIVNDNDPSIKKNRLELLKMLCKSFENYFNFSKIEA